MRPEIERVIEGMREGYDQDLNLDELGEMARLSNFHMARLFRQETGLPPMAFLTAVRMEQARRKLLFAVGHTVADIAVQVGYSSLGAFSNRFTDIFGVPPGRYRRLIDLGRPALSMISCTDDAPYAYGAVFGQLHRADQFSELPAFIAAFPVGSGNGARPASARYARCRRTPRSAGSWQIPYVPEGNWCIRAVSNSGTPERRFTLLGSSGPVYIKPGASVRLDIKLMPPGPDLPMDESRKVLGARLPELFMS